MCSPASCFSGVLRLLSPDAQAALIAQESLRLSGHLNHSEGGPAMPAYKISVESNQGQNSGGGSSGGNTTSTGQGTGGFFKHYANPLTTYVATDHHNMSLVNQHPEDPYNQMKQNQNMNRKSSTSGNGKIGPGGTYIRGAQAVGAVAPGSDEQSTQDSSDNNASPKSDANATNDSIDTPTAFELQNFKSPLHIKGSGATRPPFIDGCKTLIDGQVLPWTGDYEDVFSPIHMENNNDNDDSITADQVTSSPIKIGRQAIHGPTEAVAAVRAASSAYNNGRGEWPSMSLEERAGCIRGLMKDLKENKREMIIAALMWEICKNSADAATEFDRTLLFLENVINSALEDNKKRCYDPKTTKPLGGLKTVTKRSPIGVMLAFGPSNYPLNETYATMIPAILMGNTCVMKIPNKGGLAHSLTMESFVKCLPRGVMNFVGGQGRIVAGPMMQSGMIDLLAFVGSSRACDAILGHHPQQHRLKTLLSLDAKNCAIILPDADLELAAKECTLGATSYNGQRCTALKMIFVHRSKATEFCQKISKNINCTGDPMSTLNSGLVAASPFHNTKDLPNNGKPPQITPLACTDISYIEALVNDAISKGAKVINAEYGGGYRDRSMYFPAVLFPVKSDMRIWNEEQFGPAVPIAVFDDVMKDVVENYMDKSKFGMQCSVFSQNTGSGGNQSGMANGTGSMANGNMSSSNPNALTPSLIQALALLTCRVNINVQCSRGPDVLPFAGRKSTGRGVMGEKNILEEVSIETLCVCKEGDKSNMAFEKVAGGNSSSRLFGGLGEVNGYYGNGGTGSMANGNMSNMGDKRKSSRNSPGGKASQSQKMG